MISAKREGFLLNTVAETVYEYSFWNNLSQRKDDIETEWVILENKYWNDISWTILSIAR